MNTENRYVPGARLSLVALIALTLTWELAGPGGPSWVALKTVPLLALVRGVWRRDLYILQIAAMLVLAYFVEGVMRVASDLSSTSRLFASGEIVLSLIFSCARSSTCDPSSARLRNAPVHRHE